MEGTCHRQCARQTDGHSCSIFAIPATARGDADRLASLKLLVPCAPPNVTSHTPLEQLGDSVDNTPVDILKTDPDGNGHACVPTPVPFQVTQTPEVKMQHHLPAVAAVETALVSTPPRDKKGADSSTAAFALLTDMAPDYVNHMKAAASLRPSVAAKLQAEKKAISRKLSQVNHLRETYDGIEQLCARRVETDGEIQRLDLEKTKCDKDMSALWSVATSTNGIPYPLVRLRKR
ncbi:uncharacterized protein LY79DRAFT_681242 [Colletotrichum navitas]|uniref:Uncharacterized protein n=1 Tax=Colletotrichum navitas TaxID=681940 RepID=A0AAD8UYW2_9PEZI|nr:uncharacterized protein LY79DRAFT_681242 [Colletotrichum navitas]KAK1566256.1 hypothetical protein LY79DRAFT_681242 [Colletotrichum navitas]